MLVMLGICLDAMAKKCADGRAVSARFANALVMIAMFLDGMLFVNNEMLLAMMVRPKD